MRSGQPFEEWRREAIHKLEGRWLGRTQGELWDELPPAEKAKRQSAQILRREKQEAKRQQEALANLERAAQKERRQEAKARAQEEALAQRLVERSQKEREEEARRLEEVERNERLHILLGTSNRDKAKSQQEPIEQHQARLSKLSKAKTLSEVEKILRTCPTEYAAIFDLDGKLQEVIGSNSRNSVFAYVEDVPPKFIITHNHPSNENMSIMDLLMLKTGAVEIRTVIQDGVFSFKLHEHVQKTYDMDVLLKELTHAYNEADNALGNMKYKGNQAESTNLLAILIKSTLSKYGVYSLEKLEWIWNGGRCLMAKTRICIDDRLWFELHAIARQLDRNDLTDEERQILEKQWDIVNQQHKDSINRIIAQLEAGVSYNDLKFD